MLAKLSDRRHARFLLVLVVATAMSLLGGFLLSARGARTIMSASYFVAKLSSHDDPGQGRAERDQSQAVSLNSTTEPPRHGALQNRTTESATGFEYSTPFSMTKHEHTRAEILLSRLLMRTKTRHKCEDKHLIRNRVEGSWVFCGDDDFALTTPCLVYSFGINYDFTFDDALGRLGCSVYSFDPSMNTSSHRRSTNVQFYQIGLWGEDTDSYVPHLDQYVRHRTVWRMRTLSTLISSLGHGNRTIDLVKMDIESSEWDSVRNMVDTGVLWQVKQLLLEWHIFPTIPARKTFPQLVALLHDLQGAGFQPFHIHPHGKGNTNWAPFTMQSDMGYVNTRFLTS